jgi:hypothetical protein
MTSALKHVPMSQPQKIQLFQLELKYNYGSDLWLQQGATHDARICDWQDTIKLSI